MRERASSPQCYNLILLRLRCRDELAPFASGRRSSLFVGEWLSLVEHLVRDQGVGGSNPLSPTNLFSLLQQGRERQNRSTRFCTRSPIMPTRINAALLAQPRV